MTAMSMLGGMDRMRALTVNLDLFRKMNTSMKDRDECGYREGQET